MTHNLDLIYKKLKNDSENLKLSEVCYLYTRLDLISKIGALTETNDESEWLLMFLRHMITCIREEIVFKKMRGHLTDDVFESYYYFNNMNDIRDAFLYFESDVTKKWE